MTNRAPHLQNTISYGNILVTLGLIASGMFAYTTTHTQVQTNASAIIELKKTSSFFDGRIRTLETNDATTSVKLDQIFRSLSDNEELIKEVLNELRSDKKSK